MRAGPEDEASWDLQSSQEAELLRDSPCRDIPAEPGRNGATHNCEQAAEMGTALLPRNTTLKLKTYCYLPPPCHPRSLQLITFALAPSGCCGKGGSCSVWLSARGTSRSPSCSIPASTSLIKAVCTMRRTGLPLPFSPCIAPMSAGAMIKHSPSWLSACVGRDPNISTRWLCRVDLTTADGRSALKHGANTLAAGGKTPKRPRIQKPQQFFAGLFCKCH